MEPNIRQKYKKLTYNEIKVGLKINIVLAGMRLVFSLVSIKDLTIDSLNTHHTDLTDLHTDFLNS